MHSIVVSLILLSNICPQSLQAGEVGTGLVEEVEEVVKVVEEEDGLWFDVDVIL